MNQLNAMRAFRCIVELGSFTAAAERLDTTHSTLSRQLQQLEGLLGVALLQRNTRGLRPTAGGQQYYKACVDIIERLEAAGHALETGGCPRGPLRVSVPLSVGTLELGDWLPAWRQACPQVQLQLCSDDRFVDLVTENFDVAVRIVPALADTSLQARLLARSEVVLVASPGYVQQYGLPRDSSELAGHERLAFAGGATWQLQDASGKVAVVETSANFGSDSITVLHAAALAGVGVAAFTASTVAADLRAGRLIRLLPGYTLGERRYYALYPQTRHLSPQARAFIDFMARHYAG